MNTQKASPLPIAAPDTTPWLMLFSRITLFALCQALLALGFFLIGTPQAWEPAANWWLLTVAAADAICLVLLVRVFAAEGNRFWSLFRIERAHIKGDLLVMLVVTVLVAPISYLPNIWVAQALFGSPEATLDLIVRPLPFWAVVAAMLLFSIGQGLTELPTYFGYVMPRLQRQEMRKWLAVLIPSMVLALQHVAAPLLFDARFIAWRGLMFIPFALFAGVTLYWRPRLMPYVVAVHIFMDMTFAAMFLGVAY